MKPARAQCPVLTCTREMPAAQPMCTHCWQKVPHSLRKAIDRLPHDRGGRQRARLIEQAIALAQGADT